MHSSMGVSWLKMTTSNTLPEQGKVVRNSVAKCRLLFRNFRPKDRALLSSALIGSDVGAMAVAWCACVWGIAGAEIAAVFLVTNAVLQHLVSYLVSGAGSAGRPLDFKHVDGGVYNGEWSGLAKEGLGVYRYHLITKIA
jgi:hypothetical protein